MLNTKGKELNGIHLLFAYQFTLYRRKPIGCAYLSLGGTQNSLIGSFWHVGRKIKQKC